MIASPSWRGTPAGRPPRPSIGNERTSVDSSIPRCSCLSALISSGPTKMRPSSPSSTPSDASTSRASALAASASTSMPLRFETSTAITSLSAPLGAGLLCVKPVGLDDPLYELVPDHVLVPEANEGHTVQRAEDVLHLDQARGLLPRQVDLRHVSGHDDLRAEAESRQVHLHLLRSRLLRLVEDDERVVQRPSAHEGERGHLDHTLLHVRGQPVRLEHVVKRVEEWPQVGVDLLEQSARQEAEPLAGLHGRAREDDPSDLPVREGRNRERHGEVRLA